MRVPILSVKDFGRGTTDESALWHWNLGKTFLVPRVPNTRLQIHPAFVVGLLIDAWLVPITRIFPHLSVINRKYFSVLSQMPD